MCSIIGVFIVLFFVLNAFAGEWKSVEWGIEEEKKASCRFKTIFFLDENTGWIGGAAGNGGPIPYFIYTNDGGKNWYNLNKSLGINDIWFSDKKNGLMVANGNFVHKTSDGGRTWEKTFQLDWHPHTSVLHSIDFPHDNEHGWVAGISVIAFTEDGGQTWSPGISGMDIKTNEPMYASGNSVCFPKDNLTGWATSCYVLHTEDGGKNWKTQTLGLYPRNLFRVVFSKDLKKGWAIGNYVERASDSAALRGPIIQTVDGGKKWSDATQPHKVTLYDIIMPGETELWAVGEKGTILHTTDGDMWEKVNSPTESDLYGIFAIGDTIWATGENGTVLKYELKPAEEAKKEE